MFSSTIESIRNAVICQTRSLLRRGLEPVAVVLGEHEAALVSATETDLGLPTAVSGRSGVRVEATV